MPFLDVEAGAAVDARKSASFVSQHSNVSDPEQPLVQSTAHIGAQSEHYLEEDEGRDTTLHDMEYVGLKHIAFETYLK